MTDAAGCAALSRPTVLTASYALCPTDPTRFQAKSGPQNRAVRYYLVLPEKALCCVTPRSRPCPQRCFPTRLTQPTLDTRSARSGRAEGNMLISTL